jgi:hypothetical protein
MQNLRKIIKKAASTILMPAILAGAIAVSPKKTQAEDKKLSFTIEDKLNYSDKFANDKLRITLVGSNYLMRLDKNEGRQSQVMFTYTPLNKNKTTLTLIYAGDINDQKSSGSYGPAISLTQKIGELPLFGDSSVRLFGLTSLKKDTEPYSKASVHILGESFDSAYQLTKGRDGKTDPQGYLAFHNKDFHVSLGKSAKKSIDGVFMWKSTNGLGLAVNANYNLETKTLSIFAKNSFKGARQDIYNQEISRLFSNLFTLGTVEVNQPIFTSYSTFGETTQHFELEISPEKWLVSNEIGVGLSKNVGAGAGMRLRHANDKTKLSPSIAMFANYKIFGQPIYLEGNYRDGKIGFYTKTGFKF